MPDTFNHRIVRDLAWALLSPPLLQQLNVNTNEPSLLSNDYLDPPEAINQWLADLDQSPDTLIEYIRLRSQVRIGIYFEQLIGFYFKHYPRFELLHQNLQVQGKKNTLGEFDFIVFDKNTQRVFHIEAAVKFYLGNFDTQAVPNNIDYYDWHHWIGPNKKDSMSLKMHSMLNKQLKLGQTKAAQELLAKNNIDAENLTTRVLLRGRFFYHNNQQQSPQFSNPLCCNYCWQHITEFMNKDSNEYNYFILPRSHWLSPITVNDIEAHSIQSKDQLIKTIMGEKQRGINTWKVAKLNTQASTIETARFFIVDDTKNVLVN